CQHNYDTPFTF
nr:immunoglobulin light chain junction region [Macaca mulatta]MOW74424.1 immunoglobulin light chain junction region [Macaca mulatta]